jgi:co-chaperonin GroES (HSP10)
MNFTPFNRYILVEPIEEPEEEQNVSIVLPENYNKPASAYLRCKVLASSRDSKFSSLLSSGDHIIIERRMLCNVDITEKPVYLVLENYIYGRITDENNTRIA